MSTPTPIKLRFVTYEVCPHCEGMCVDCFDAATLAAELRGRIAELELWVSQNWSPYNNSRFNARIAALRKEAEG